jgi:hypothetical protein
MHSDISGGVYDNGRQIINGANISVSSAKRVYSGHIHKAQVNKNLTYIGYEAFDSNEITIHFTGEIKPFVITSEYDINHIQLILPVRI